MSAISLVVILSCPLLLAVDWWVSVIRPKHHYYGSRAWVERELHLTRERVRSLEALLLERSSE